MHFTQTGFDADAFYAGEILSRCVFMEQGPMRGLGTDTVTYVPMKGLAENSKGRVQKHRQTDKHSDL